MIRQARTGQRRAARGMRVRFYIISAVRRALVVASVFAAACTATPPQPSAPARSSEFDVVITGGRVVDGTGAPWFARRRRHRRRSDHRDRQARAAATAATRIDATGLVVAPGFIDMLGQSEFNVLVDSRAASKITQGVTTEITGEGTPSRRSTIAWPPAQAAVRLVQGHARFPHARRILRPARDALGRRSTSAPLSARAASAPTSSATAQRAATADELEQMKTLVARPWSRARSGSARRCSTCPDRFASHRRDRRTGQGRREQYGGI